MQIHRLYNNNAGRNFSYVIDNGESACAVDPYYPELIISYLEKNGLRLKSVINTHEHADHTRGNAGLLKYANCRVASRALGYLDQQLEIINEEPATSTQILEWKEGLSGQIVQTPGHTMQHISIFFFGSHGQLRAVICGDTLFSAGVGNCRHGGDIGTLFNTLEKIFYRLPDKTLIYPGHEYWDNNLKFSLSLEPDNQKAQGILSRLSDDPAQAPVSTIAIERQVNPFFRLDKHCLDGEDKFDTFVRLRSLRDNW